MYLIAKHKIPKKNKIGFVNTEKKAQSIAKKYEEITGKKPHIYKIEAPKKLKKT